MLVSVEHIADNVLLGLWQIDVDNALSPRKNEQRAVQQLLTAMTGGDAVEITHEESGKPVLDGWHISISHTKGYAAVLLSKNHEVASISNTLASVSSVSPTASCDQTNRLRILLICCSIGVQKRLFINSIQNRI